MFSHTSVFLRLKTKKQQGNFPGDLAELLLLMLAEKLPPSLDLTSPRLSLLCLHVNIDTLQLQQ